MSLPSQVGRTPGRTPRVESRDEPRFGKHQLLLGAVGGAVLLAVLVIAIVATRGGPDEGTRAVAPITDPLAQVETREPGESPATARAGSTGDAALDAVMGGGTPARETPAPEPEPEMIAAGNDGGPEEDAAIESVLSTPTHSPTKGMLTDMFEQDAGEGETAAGGPDGQGADTTAHASADGELAGLPEAGTIAGEALTRADHLRKAGRLLAARDELNLALSDDQIGRGGLGRVRAAIMELNETLVFSAHIEPGDDMAIEYRVKSGDSLARIARAQGLGTHWKLIARVNGIENPSRINIGQRLKLVRGPFHAVVDKSDFRLDVYHGPAGSPREWVYVTSMPVGLGADDGTPIGTFVVAPGKLENPGWVNPRDSTERYERNDPANPIGEFWVGLDGVGESAEHEGYGLHGTIDPGSIGKTMSMGCVRLGDDDIALMYELLTEGESVVHIVP